MYDENAKPVEDVKPYRAEIQYFMYAAKDGEKIKVQGQEFSFNKAGDYIVRVPRGQDVRIKFKSDEDFSELSFEQFASICRVLNRQERRARGIK